MQHSVLSPSPDVAPVRRARRLAAVAAGAVVAAVLAMLAVVAVQANFASFAIPAPPTTGVAASAGETDANVPGAGADALEQPFLPAVEDGLITEGTLVTPTDDDVPAIARLDPALLGALREAQTDASADGIRAFQVSSGWRSDAYQRWLLEDAIVQYGSEEVARQFVATPERSKHVTGDAVDIGSSDAQTWLIENGARYGLCQTYANERWHFELATAPGGECPAMKADATS